MNLSFVSQGKRERYKAQIYQINFRKYESTSEYTDNKCLSPRPLSLSKAIINSGDRQLDIQSSKK